MEEKYELSLREYYDILHDMCEILEKNPDDETATAAFIDAAYNLAKANCGHFFPENFLASDKFSMNAATVPSGGIVLTSVKEEDDNNVVQ